MTNRKRLLALAGFTLVATPLAAQGDTVAGRISAYRELGAAYKNVNDQLRSGTPNAYLIQVSAREIRKVATDQYSYFPAGSTGGKSKALPTVWSKPALFKQRQDAFKAQADSFYAVTRSGDMAKIRTASAELGQTCKACHKQFRQED